MPDENNVIGIEQLSEYDALIKNYIATHGGGGSYVLPIASASQLGGIKVGNNLSITQDGTLSADAQQYTLPTASASTLGGIKVGNNLNIDQNGTLNNSISSLNDLSDVQTLPLVRSYENYLKFNRLTDKWISAPIRTTDLQDFAFMEDPENGERIKYSSGGYWTKERGKTCDLLYDSGDMNTYAPTSFTNTFFDIPLIDVGGYSVHKYDIEDYDELLIIFGFKDWTYQSTVDGDFMNGRLDIKAYASLYSDWKTRTNGYTVPIGFFGFCDEDVQHLTDYPIIRDISFRLTCTTVTDAGGYTKGYKYGFAYSSRYTNNDKPPGIRKIYGIRR